MIHRIARSVEIGEVLDLIRRGGVIIYPTETVYGLGCLASVPSAIERVAALKGSESDASFLILIRGRASLSDFCREVPASASKLMDYFWPGPLTLVLPALESLHPHLVGPSGGVAVRQSSHPWLQTLLDNLQDGLISTSANPSGKPAPDRVEELDSRLAEKTDLVINGGRLKSGVSTVLDLCQDPPVLRRAGAVSAPEIEEMIGPVILD